MEAEPTLWLRSGEGGGGFDVGCGRRLGLSRSPTGVPTPRLIARRGRGEREGGRQRGWRMMPLRGARGGRGGKGPDVE